MRNKAIKLSAVIVASSLLLAGTAQAFNMGNMMNPGDWFDDDDDDYYRHGRYYGRGYGPYLCHRAFLGTRL